jgi:hypothetical protein
MAPAAIRSLSRAVLSSKRKICATPSRTPASRAASTIWRHSSAFIAIGFSQSTGLPARIAVSTSEQWHTSGEVTNTASTSGQRQSSSVEPNTWGMEYCRAASCAFRGSRRDRAVTVQFWASLNPGISRRTACNPNPAIPKRIIMLGLCPQPLRVGIENKKQQRQQSQGPQRWPDFARPSGDHLAERI